MPSIPTLPGSGPVPALHDTATGHVGTAADGDQLRLYVCGITPYDAAHLGHAATYVAFDLLNRAARDAGLTVRYTQNVTDVDDPLLERARDTGDDWRALADREIERFRDDMAALAVLPPDRYLGVVESLPLIEAMIEVLAASGAAYRVDGDWYLDLSRDTRFGGVGRLPEDQMLALFAERGGDPQRVGKRHPLDSLLWSAERAGEPSWPSPLGAGRPGWHVECVAIAREGLGTAFEVQGGGSDLVFPHHEMCASVSRIVDGQEFAQHYAHTGMVALDGEKMSKSKGNLEFVSRLRAQGTEPAAIRLALLAHHYRSDWEWTSAELDAAESRLTRWRQAVTRSSGPDGAALLNAVRVRIADDLDAPAALQLVDEWAASEGDDATAPALVADLVDALLGVQLA
jgi:L-cysteine:1D-myo-inositol 2-amino-2-deoxy-alpha-D-glucopyranoside ligase